ncbi:efflux RND transporter periplasmic adaptor subunit [Rhodoferax sp. GW822-FHT02A01]|uniref:efflux RND transporter periplasmic adaptor subunit n=1 Tax=Rhodoferax sp. GW822-FHT02A01 TaxID=3141537 RepID=UPI00315D9CDE
MTKISFPSKLRWRHIAAALALLAVVYFAVTWWLGPKVNVETVVRHDFVQSVVASGHVESPHRVDIGSQITATVTRVPVNEGDSVTAGTLLIALANSELQATERQADLAVIQAQGKLRQLQEVQAPVAEQALRQAQSSLDNANASYRRNQDLFKQGFIGQAALDDSRKAAELADAQFHSAQKQLETTGKSGSDYALALSAVEEARAAADAAHARAKYALVRSPLDGTLIGRSVEVGDVVQPGKVLMTLSPKGKTQVVVAIDEKNLHLIRLGQKAVVSADAYPQQKFEAQLVYINPGVNAQTGAVDVKLDVPQPPEVLRQDMTVSVDIEVARRPRALMLPASTVRDAESAAPWVLRVQDGRAAKVLVQIGLRSGSMLEALQGVQEGDLLVSGSPSVKPGDRVRVAATVH